MRKWLQRKGKKAEKSTKNNAYRIVHGKDRYVREATILKETGEVLDEKQTARVSAVDREKAEKDALHDGCFAIITSELDYDAAKIREVYHGLWRIEESFRIMKSDFDARPIYLNNREHIRAHFQICFMALVLSKRSIFMAAAKDWIRQMIAENNISGGADWPSLIFLLNLVQNRHIIKISILPV